MYSRQVDWVTLKFKRQGQDQPRKPLLFIGCKQVCVQAQTTTHPEPRLSGQGGVVPHRGWGMVRSKPPLLSMSFIVPSPSSISS